MSRTGTATGSPATDASFVRRSSPPAHSATSVEVPPMSNVMMSSIPAPRAACVAPTTPPAGPERIVRTGSSAATRAEMLPPDDCITRRLRAETCAPREREEQADGDRLDARALQPADELFYLPVFESDDDRAVRRDALAHAEPQPVGDERRGPRPVQIIKAPARLPPDDQHVLEPFGRHQAYARAAAFEQRVRADGRPVHDFQITQTRARLPRRAPEALDDRARRVVRRRGHLENPRAPFGVIDEVRERPARVHADAHDRYPSLF